MYGCVTSCVRVACVCARLCFRARVNFEDSCVIRGEFLWVFTGVRMGEFVVSVCVCVGWSWYVSTLPFRTIFFTHVVWMCKCLCVLIAVDHHPRGGIFLGGGVELGLSIFCYMNPDPDPDRDLCSGI